MNRYNQSFALLLTLTLATTQLAAQQAAGQAAVLVAAQPGDFIVHNFHFQSGETLPEVRMHYTTLGKPIKDASGRTTNAVLILHGTGGTGSGLLRPIFAGVLFGPGQLLEANKY